MARLEPMYGSMATTAVWLAADKFAPIEGGFVKLAMLLGVRKSELAGMRRSEFDDTAKPTVWTVPHERVKIKKSAKKECCYVVPLPVLAQRTGGSIFQDYLVILCSFEAEYLHFHIKALIFS